MSYFATLGSFIGLCTTIALVYVFWPARGQHERPRAYEADVWQPRDAPRRPLTALPAPRLAVDDWPIVPAHSVALSAVRHPCYKYAANLAAMSWQSHKTLQRNYDVLAFATVARAYYKTGATYAG